jgi:hypothetical protein
LIFAAALLLLSLLVMKTSPFVVFFHQIVPTLGLSTPLLGNQSLQGFLLRIGHRELLPASVLMELHVAQLAVLVVLLWLIFRQPREFWNYPMHVFAACCALVAWLLIFAPIFWDHYHAYLYPFWGWLAWEATRSSARFWLVVCIMAASYAPTPLLQTFRLPEPVASHLLFAALAMLGLAIARLAVPLREQTHADSQ